MKISHCLLIVVFSLTSIHVQAQYWIGIKGGPSYIMHDYQFEDYKDSFNIEDNSNFHIGAIMTYVASKRFAVTTELNYERRSRTLSNIPDVSDSATSVFNTHYLTAPILLQVNFGGSPISFYVNGGIKLNYWMAGNGTLYTPDIGLFTDGKAVDYNIVFNESDPKSGQKSINDPNRLQYGLSAGTGFYLDVVGGGRVLVDFRYNFSHSNLGFNGRSEDFFDSAVPYYENFEYRNHSITVSVGYLLYYNSQFKRKGASTAKVKK
jgi:hypothetical protein